MMSSLSASAGSLLIAAPSVSPSISGIIMSRITMRYGSPSAQRGAEGVERRPGAVHLGVPAAPGVEHAGDDLAVGRVVVHREDAHAGDVDRLEALVGGGQRRGVLLREAGGEPERRAGARLALDADLAAHELDEAPADGQAEAGAAVPPRGGGVGLRERLEQHVELLGRDADAGVAHREAQRRRGLTLLHEPHRHRHLAALGELDGVADQVGEHLAQAPRVAAQEPRGRRARPAR